LVAVVGGCRHSCWWLGVFGFGGVGVFGHSCRWPSLQLLIAGGVWVWGVEVSAAAVGDCRHSCWWLGVFEFRGLGVCQSQFLTTVATVISGWDCLSLGVGVVQSQLLMTVYTVVGGWAGLGLWGFAGSACASCLWCVPLCWRCSSLRAFACCVLAVPVWAVVHTAAVPVGVRVAGLRCPLSSRPPPASHGVHSTGTLARAASSGQLLCSHPPVQSVDQSGWEFSGTAPL